MDAFFNISPLLVITQSFEKIPLMAHNLCQGDKEVIGTLRGFDEYVNMVLDDVTEYEITPTGKKEVILI